jgi:hypothetical protein
MNGNSNLMMANNNCGKPFGVQQPGKQTATMPAAFNQRLMTPAVPGDMTAMTPAAQAAPAAFNQRSMMPAAAGETMPQPVSITPATLESVDFLAGLLTTFVGHRVRAQFLIGTNGPLVDVQGTLLQVGANYIILQPVETDDLMVCDLFSIKFLTVFQ